MFTGKYLYQKPSTCLASGHSAKKVVKDLQRIVALTSNRHIQILFYSNAEHRVDSLQSIVDLQVLDHFLLCYITLEFHSDPVIFSNVVFRNSNE